MEITEMNKQWSRNLFDSLAEHGRWAVPRSGLIFARQGDKLVLVFQLAWEPMHSLAVKPYSRLVATSAEELTAYQDEDFNVIKEVFGEAGIEVMRT